MAIEYQPLYILSSGMLLQQRKLETITNNLANVDTPSFKRDFMLASLWETPMGQRVADTDPQNPNNNFQAHSSHRRHNPLQGGRGATGWCKRDSCSLRHPWL